MGNPRTTVDERRPEVGRPASTALRVQVMGPLRVWRGDVELDTGARQQRCLLAVLVAREGSPTSMAELIDLIWGPDAPATAANVIHKYVGALRRLLEPGLGLRAQGAYLLRHGDGYRFVAGPGMLDLVEFRRLVAGADLDHYVAALRLARGSAGGALAGGGTVSPIFAGVDQEFFDAVVDGAALAVSQGRPAAVLGPLRLAAEMSAFHELVHAALVRTLAAAGHQAEALAAYRVIRERLADELGIDPGRELQDAQRRVLSGTVARPAPSVHPAQLPPDQSLFAGRTHELDVLSELLARTGDGPLVIALDGMGGVGKSTLATHFAHRVAGRFPDGQLYLDLQGHRAGGGEALRSLLYALGVRGDDMPDTPDAWVGLYRSLTASRRFLVLLDNALDADQVRPLLPSSAGSLVLVTGRRPLIGLAASHNAHLLRVDRPDPAQARALLAKRLGTVPNRRFAGAADATAMAEIVALCGRLPRALAMVAARLSARPHLSLAAVTAELRDGVLGPEVFPWGPGIQSPSTGPPYRRQEYPPHEGVTAWARTVSPAPEPGRSITWPAPVRC
jgi:DNA-binding SARP family transcriptional activator